VDDDLVITRSVRVPRRELEWTFTTAGTAGGQHANRNATKAELRFDIESSSAFTEVQRANLAKERAAGATDRRSKRGSGLDVVKPEGWRPPDVAGVLRRHGWQHVEQ